MMDFEDHGLDRDPKGFNGTGADLDFLSHKNEPIISFSPDRCRFETNNGKRNSNGNNGIADLVTGHDPSTAPSTIIIRSRENPRHRDRASQPEPQNSSQGNQLREVAAASEDNSGLTPNCSDYQNRIGSHLQRRLEKHIAQASMGSSKPPSVHHVENGNYAEKGFMSSSLQGELCPSEQSFNHSVRQPMTATALPNTTTTPASKTIRTTASVTTSSSASMPASAGDMRKIPGLLPPQRLAIPNKSNPGSASHHLHRQEFKPLVQWDSEESEEELSFFPAPKKQRSTLTDNLSIDNMSLSGEEDDLHLSPPRAMTSRCPCDPRLLIDSKFSASSSAQASSSSRRAKQCVIV